MKQFPWRLRISWRLTGLITPWLRSSQELYFERLMPLLRPKTRILDIGCGKEFVLTWFRPDLYRRWSAVILENATIFGIDSYLPSLRENAARLNACALADRIPFAESMFDLVTANMVVEHLAEPESVLREALRVLKPGGAFLFHTPNLRTPVMTLSRLLPHFVKKIAVPILEGGRGREDVFPTLYRMNTKGAIAAAAVRAGFEVERIEHVFTSPFTQMLGPFVILELLIVRLTRGERFASFRPDLICLLRKNARGQSGFLPLN